MDLLAIFFVCSLCFTSTPGERLELKILQNVDVGDLSNKVDGGAQTQASDCEVNGTKYNVGDEIEIFSENCKKFFCNASDDGSTFIAVTYAEHCNKCFHDDKSYNQGDVVATYPDFKAEMVCQVSNITGRPILTVQGEKTDYCLLGGKRYEDGHLLSNDSRCMFIRCNRGVWRLTGLFNYKCRQCNAYIDGSKIDFITFDGKWYSTQTENCSYSVLNNKNNSNIVSFRGPGVHSISFSDNDSDPVTCPIVDFMNGCSFGSMSYFPVEVSEQGTLVFAFEYNEEANINFLDGSNGITVVFYVNSMTVLAHESLKGKISGLCGDFNGNQTDDFTTSSGDLTTDLKKFVASWATSGDNCTATSGSVGRRSLPDYQVADDDLSDESLELVCREQIKALLLAANIAIDFSEEMKELREFRRLINTCISMVSSCPREQRSTCLVDSMKKNEMAIMMMKMIMRPMGQPRP